VFVKFKKKTQRFKCYLAMPIAVTADPHWCSVKQYSGVWQSS